MCKSFQSWPSGAPLFRLPHLSTPSLYSPTKYPSSALSSTTQSLLHIRGAWRSLSWVPQPGGWKLLHIPLVYTEILTSFCACTFLRETPCFLPAMCLLASSLPVYTSCFTSAGPPMKCLDWLENIHLWVFLVFCFMVSSPG